MAVKVYTTPVNFGSFDEWSNNIASDSNVALSSAMGDMYPAQSSPYSVSTLANETIFYGTVTAGTGGTVSMTAPYTVSATSSFSVKNVIISDNNITIVATASYPYAFNSWRTAASGGGSSISTSATLTLTAASAAAANLNFYAYFTTTHTDPSS